jgi:hypothetical protein
MGIKIMDNMNGMTLSKYCRILDINLIALSKKTAVAIRDIQKLYNQSVYDFEVFALKNNVKFEPMYAMDYKPIPVNNNKLVVKYPFKFMLVGADGKEHWGTVRVTKESMGIKVLKLKYPKSTDHKLKSIPNSWITSVKMMGSDI